MDANGRFPRPHRTKIDTVVVSEGDGFRLFLPIILRP
jgi:hypothetical protein